MSDRTYAMLVDGKPVLVRSGEGFTDAKGVQHPPDWDEKMTPQQKVSHGLRLVDEPPPPAEGQQRAAKTLKVGDDGKIKFEAGDRPTPLSVHREEVAARIEHKMAEKVAAGAAISGGIAVGLDASAVNRFLIIHAIAQHAINAGRADEPLEIEFPAADGPVLMTNIQAVQASYEALLAHARLVDDYRTMRRQAATAGSLKAIAAIDVDGGWSQG